MNEPGVWKSSVLFSVSGEAIVNVMRKQTNKQKRPSGSLVLVSEFAMDICFTSLVGETSIDVAEFHGRGYMEPSQTRRVSSQALKSCSC